MKKAKKTLARVLAPVADKTAREYLGIPCSFVFCQPKLPKKLENTVK